MRVESEDIRYPHFSGDNQTDCTRPFFLPRKKRPGPEAKKRCDRHVVIAYSARAQIQIRSRVGCRTVYVYRNGSGERRQRYSSVINYSSCCKLLGVRRNTPPSRDCGESVRDGERRLSIHSYWWWQVAVLCSASSRVRHASG